MDIFVLQQEAIINNYVLEFDIYRKNINGNNMLILCQGYSLSKDYWPLYFIENILYCSNIDVIVCYNYRGFTSKKIPSNELLGVPSSELSLALLSKDLYQFILFLQRKFGKQYHITLLGHSMGTFIVHKFLDLLSNQEIRKQIDVNLIIFISGGCHCSFDFLEKFNDRNFKQFVEQSANSKSKRYVTLQTLISYAMMIFLNRLQNKCDYSFLSKFKIHVLDIYGENDNFLTFHRHGNCIQDNWNPEFYTKKLIKNGNHHLLNHKLNQITEIINQFLCKS